MIDLFIIITQGNSVDDLYTLPLVGEVFDAFDTLIYLGQGQNVNAILSFSATISLVGEVAKYSIKGIAKSGYSLTSIGVRSTLSDRIWKRSFSEVGYQFQKHFGRRGNWGGLIPNGATLNPSTFNDVGYRTFKEIWRAPGSFQNVAGFIEKRLPDERGIRFQEDWKFKGFFRLKK